MKRKIFTYSILLAAAAAMPFMISCKGKKTDDTATETTKKTVAPQSIQVEIFSPMPVKGDDSEYFSIAGPNESAMITVTGTPDTTGFSPKGIVRFDIDLTVLKRYNDKIHKLGSYNGMSFSFLDEDHEEVATLNISKTDMEVIVAELGKDNPGTVSLKVKDDMYERSYNEFFQKAKYIRLEDADIESETEYEGRSSSVTKTSVSSSSSSSYDDDDDSYSSSSSSSSSSSDSDYDDSDDSDDSDDRTSMKAALKKAGKKVSSKTKDLKDKAAEKLNDWLDR